MEVYADWNDIYKAILAKLGGSRRTLGLKDYYPHWARQGEAADAGKLILVDRSADGVHQIMFDDNIERDHVRLGGKRWEKGDCLIWLLVAAGVGRWCCDWAHPHTKLVGRG